LIDAGHERSRYARQRVNDPNGLNGLNGLLRSYLAPHWRRVLLVAVLLLCSIGLQLASPLVVRHFIDAALAGADLRTLISAALLYGAIALLQQSVAVADVYLGEYLGWVATNALRADLTRHCLRLGPSFHQAHAPGELIERIDGDVTALANFLSRFLVVIAGNGLLLLGMLAVLWHVHWQVGLTFAVFSAAAFAALGGLRRIGGRVWAARNQAIAAFFSVVEEQFVALEDLQGTGAGAYALRRQDDLARQGYRSAVVPNLLSGGTWSATIVLFSAATAIAFALGAHFFAAGAMSMGTVYLLFSYAELLRRPVEQLTQQFQDLHQATGSIVRVQALFDTPVDLPVDAPRDSERGYEESTGVFPRLQPVRPGAARALASSPALPAGALRVEFEAVTFAYPGAVTGGAPTRTSSPAAPAIREVSFRLEPGQVLGVVSGARGVARRRWRGSCSASMTRPAAPSVSRGSTFARSSVTTCASTPAWSRRTCRFSRAVSGTT
jgi:ATP-binding cassette, subfamily B, bacterial